MPHDSHAHHGHSHDHSHHSTHHHAGAYKNILGAFILNLCFSLIEFVGAFFTGSVAILADAVHDLGDTVSLGLALFLEKYSQRAASSEFSYGYRRLSLLSALITGATMLAVSLVIFVEIFRRLLGGHNPVPHSMGMVGLAIVGIAFNGFAAWRLSKGHTQNEKVLYWHLLEDVSGWVLILIGALIIRWTAWTWVDPALALVMGLYIFWNVLKNLRETVRLFLQGRPSDFNLAAFRTEVLALSGVVDVHDLHAWSLDGHQNVLSLHLVLDPAAASRAAELKREVAAVVHRQSRTGAPYHLTIETEFRDEDCRESC